MVWTDDDGFLLKPLAPDKLMTKTDEISWIQLRRNEKKLLNDINNDKEGCLRCHVLDDRGRRKKRIQSRNEKIRLEDFSSPYHATVLFSCPEQGSSQAGGIVMTEIGMYGSNDNVIDAGVPLEDEGVEFESGKNANDRLKYIRCKFSSLDPRGRGLYQPGGIVMAMVMGVAGGDEKKLETKMTLGKMRGRSDFGRRKSGWIYVIHVSAFE